MSAPVPAAKPPHAALRAALGPLGCSQLRRHALGLAGICFVLGCALTVAATLLAERGHGQHTRALLLIALVLMTVGPAAAGVLALGARTWLARTSLARQLKAATRLWPDAADACDTAAQMVQGRLAPSASPALVLAHLGHLSIALASRPWQGAAHKRLRRTRRWVGALVVLGVVGVAIVLHSQPRGQIFVLAAVRNQRAQQLTDAALWAQAQVWITAPAYAQRPVRHSAVYNRLEALRDSHLRIAFAAAPHLGNASLGVYLRPAATQRDGQEADTVAPYRLTQTQPRSYELTHTLVQPVTLQPFADQSDGLRLIARTPIVLMALDNEVPRVTLAAPLDGEELGAHEALVVRWEAEDDLGCTHADVLLQGDASEPIALPSRIEHDRLAERARCRGALVIPAATLDLTDGESVRVSVRVFDFASEPDHAGISEVRTVQRLSKAAHHRRLLERQREVFALWVDWLAAEHPPTKTATTARLEALDEALLATQALVQALAADGLAEPHEQQAWSNALAHASHARAAIGTQARNDAARLTTLEQDILYLDDLLAHSGLDVARAGAQALQDVQAQMRTLVSQLGTSDDHAVREKLQAQLIALAQRLNDVMQRMGEVRSSVGHETSNVDAAGHHGMQDALEQLSAAIASGDAKAAAEQLGALDNMLNQLTDSLEHQGEAIGEQRYGKLREAYADAQREAAVLDREQQALAEALEEAANAAAQPNAARGKMSPGAAEAWGKRQAALGQRLQKLAHKLDSLGEQAPILGEHERKALGQAAQQMQASQDQLHAGRIGEAAGAARLGSDNVKRLHHALGQGQSGAHGIPRPTGSQAPQHLRQKGGSQGRDKVDMHKTSEQVGAELREKIRAAARNRADPRYEEQVRHFYDELMR